MGGGIRLINVRGEKMLGGYNERLSSARFGGFVSSDDLATRLYCPLPCLYFKLLFARTSRNAGSQVFPTHMDQTGGEKPSGSGSGVAFLPQASRAGKRREMKCRR